MEMDLHPNRYFYKISKNFERLGKISPYSFIVVLSQMIIEIPQSSDLSWLTLFYALPKELVWNCYAWSTWQFFKIPHKDGTYHDIPGDWSHYSGDFPLWQPFEQSWLSDFTDWRAT